MQSTLSLTLDLTTKKGFFTDTTDYNAIGVDVNTLGATGSVAVYFQGELVGSPLAINLAGGTNSPLFDLELDVNGEVANGTYSAVYTLDYSFISSVSSTAPNQLKIYTVGSNYQGFPANTFITIPVNLALGANVVSATDNAGDLDIVVDGTVTSIPPASRTITATQSAGSFSWVYAGCNLVEAKSGLAADCDYGDFGTFTVTNETDTTGITITSLNVDINYPSWTNQPVITETSLPYTNNQLATGTYSVTLTLEIQKVQDDGLIITYTSTSIQEFKVSCIGSLCGLNDCLENLRKAHEAELVRNKISKYQVYVDNILIYYTEAQSYKSCGQMDEYRAAVAKIEAQLDASGCDCGCCDENQYIWVQNTSPAASNIMQDIVALQNDVTVIQGDITVIEGDITAIQGDIATLQTDSIFTANNGLTKSGNNVALGGALLVDTTINASGNTLTIQSNATDPLVVQTTTGSPASFTVTSPTGVIEDNVRLITTALLGPGVNGIGSSISFEAEKANSAVGITSVVKSSWDNATTGDGKFEIGVTGSNVTSTAFTILSTGQAELNQYGSGTFAATPTYNLGVDASGNVVETAASSLTASNGLTETTGDIKLGGTLTENTTINADGNELIIYSGAPYADKFEIDGVNFNVKNSEISYNIIQPKSINTNAYRLNTGGLLTSYKKNVYNYSVGNPNNGWGDAEEVWLDSGNIVASNLNLASKETVSWAYNSSVSKTTRKTFYLQNDGSGSPFLNSVLSLYGEGSVALNQYGSGTFTGTPAYNLGVDATGNVVEVASSGSGPLVYAAKINGSFLGGVSLTEISNTTGATFTITASFAGYYQITCSNPSLFNNTKAVAFLTLNAGQGIGLVFISSSTAALDIETLNLSGAYSDIINYAMIKIEIYP